MKHHTNFTQTSARATPAMRIASTPKPPYFAVIFTSTRTDNENGYNEMAMKMVQLAEEQQGFLGIESAREDIGITVSYWSNLESISLWKQNVAHLEAQALGRKSWYESFRVRISKVERDYGM